LLAKISELGAGQLQLHSELAERKESGKSLCSPTEVTLSLSALNLRELAELGLSLDILLQYCYAPDNAVMLSEALAYQSAVI